jgi:hypothetical protein
MIDFWSIQSIGQGSTVTVATLGFHIGTTVQKRFNNLCTAAKYCHAQRRKYKRRTIERRRCSIRISAFLK